MLRLVCPPDDRLADDSRPEPPEPIPRPRRSHPILIGPILDVLMARYGLFDVAETQREKLAIGGKR